MHLCTEGRFGRRFIIDGICQCGGLTFSKSSPSAHACSVSSQDRYEIPLWFEYPITYMLPMVSTTAFGCPPHPLSRLSKPNSGVHLDPPYFLYGAPDGEFSRFRRRRQSSLRGPPRRRRVPRGCPSQEKSILTMSHYSALNGSSAGPRRHRAQRRPAPEARCKKS